MSTDTDNTRAALQNIRDFQSMLPVLTPAVNSLGFNFGDVTNVSSQTTVSATVLGARLERLFIGWDRLQTAMADTEAELIFRGILVNITATCQATKAFRGDAISLQATAEALNGELGNAIQGLNSRLTAERQDLAQSDGRVVQSNAAIQSLQVQLSGSKGFWKGFEQGVTLGIYHPVDDNLNDQRNLYNQAVQAYQTAERDIEQIQANTHVLLQANQSLRLVVGLGGSTVSLENIVLTISGLAAETQHDGTQLTGTTNGRVAEFFRNRFNKDMTTLAAWRDVFTFTRQPISAMPIIPYNIIG